MLVWTLHCCYSDDVQCTSVQVRSIRKSATDTTRWCCPHNGRAVGEIRLGVALEKSWVAASALGRRDLRGMRVRASGAKADGPQLSADHGVAERITVAVIPQVAEDLQLLQQRTGLSKTDAVNRAVTLYHYIDSQLRAGKDFLVRDQ